MGKVVKFDPSVLQTINECVVKQTDKKRLVDLTHHAPTFIDPHFIASFASLQPGSGWARRVSSECILKGHYHTIR